MSSPRGPGIDVGGIIRRVHFAFRPEGEGWTGGHATFSVKADRDGFSVTPIDYSKDSQASSGRVTGAPIRFGRSSLKRGGATLGSRETTGRIDPEDSHLRLLRGEVEEHLRNAEDGVEQSWTFAQAPSGEGDLEVRIPVTSGRFRELTASGLHFETGNTGLGVRYGHAVWVDARGQKTEVPARFDRGSIVLRVEERILAGAPAPRPGFVDQSGDRTDQPVSTRPAGLQMQPAVTWNGTNHFVVWRDDRSGIAQEIFGGVRQPDGSPPGTFPISTFSDGDDSDRLAVAWNGNCYLVVFQARALSNSIVWGKLVSPNGTVLPPGLMLINYISSGRADRPR